MILSSASDSRKIKQAINKILKELDLHLCCEIIKTKKHSRTFLVLNWVVDDEYFYIAHVMYKRRKTNWLTLLDLIPVLGQAWEHYDHFGNGQSRPSDEMNKMEALLYHWRNGINFLSREGIVVDEAQCYKYMLIQTTEWSKK